MSDAIAGHPIRFDFRPRGPAGRAAHALLVRPAERVLGLDRVARIYDALPHGGDIVEFLEQTLAALGVELRIADRDLGRIPAEGPAIVVANHPYGGIEGVILGLLLRRRRADARLMANYLLRRVPEFRELFVAVDPFERAGSVQRNLTGLRAGIRHVEAGGMLGVFPSGGVAHLSARTGRVDDPPWSPAVAAIARHAGCPVVPVWFGGRNSAVFQAVGLVHPLLRTAMIPREMVRMKGRCVEVRIGGTVLAKRLEQFPGDAERIAYLRDRSEILAERSPLDVPPVQPRRTPANACSIVAARPPERLSAELARLPDDQLLLEADSHEVWVARAGQIPELLEEIGRLRELSFRAVGEGTGRETDLDLFDARYRHLLLWNREKQEVVGAYRLGATDELLAQDGRQGLYTSTLFDYRPRLFEAMGPALEMGRSFIRPEYHKSYAGLMLLWKGIGRFVVAHPRYATLFGPVSISADYRSASQQLMVSFLQQNRFAHEWSDWVRPRTPRRADRRSMPRHSLAHLRDLDDVSAFISEIEADQKGVPVLLKQYLKLGGRLLGFNLDPDFSNVLDVLIMVDLRHTPRNILKRYMGRDGARSFIESHPSATARAS